MVHPLTSQRYSSHGACLRAVCRVLLYCLFAAASNVMCRPRLTWPTNRRWETPTARTRPQCGRRGRGAGWRLRATPRARRPWQQCSLPGAEVSARDPFRTSSPRLGRMLARRRRRPGGAGVMGREPGGAGPFFWRLRPTRRCRKPSGTACASSGIGSSIAISGAFGSACACACACVCV